MIDELAREAEAEAEVEAAPAQRAADRVLLHMPVDVRSV